MKHIKNFNDFLNEKKEISEKKTYQKKVLLNDIKENLNNKIIFSPYELLFVAEDIEKGFTSGIINRDEDITIEWDLMVSIKEWSKLDDSDIDMIADMIRKGELSGEDPINWSLEIGGDEMFEDSIEEEEETLTRRDIANDLDIEESELEDSSDLGKLADKVSEHEEDYNYNKEIAYDLFKEYVNNKPEFTEHFSHVIGDEFKYDIVDKILRDVLEYANEYEEEYGYLDINVHNHIFKDSLKFVIREYLKGKNLLENKKGN